MRLLQLILVVAGAWQSAQAASAVAFDAQTCVDASGFSSCMSAATSNTTSCIKSTCGSEDNKSCNDSTTCFADKGPECTNSCSCDAYLGWINCAVEHCWNKAYSCAYQYLVLNAFRYCALADVYPPYFPAPANAAGGCACNMGSVFAAQRNYRDRNTECLVDPSEADHRDDCSCCAYSGLYSAAHNICPDYDVDAIDGWSDLISEPLASLGVSNCTTQLSTATCTATAFSMPTPIDAPSVTYFAPDALPSQGTRTISDRSGSLTSPIGGSVLTWSLIHQLKTGTATATVVSPNGISGASQASTPSLRWVGVTVVVIGAMLR